MLRPIPTLNSGLQLPGKQQGVVLFIALIALVAMTLAAIALVRSVDTANVIAGNLAFQQGSTNNGDVGIEAASNWLSANNNATLFDDSTANGYLAVRQDPAAGQSWVDFWNNTLVPAGVVRTLAKDTTTGNTVSYVIHRLCAFKKDATHSGDPLATDTQCSTELTTSTNLNNSRSAGSIGLQGSTQVFYRITARIDGPRNTVSYVQAIVLL